MAAHLTKQRQFKRYEPLPDFGKRRFNWKWAGIIAGVVVLTALLTRFVDAVHYSKLLFQQQNDQQAQSEASSKDLMTILHTTPTTIACDQLQTNFATQQCHTHNAAVSGR
ncbi:MAG TPA: hypothetical protein VHT70_05920 [Candidatus Saccharimonadales bacterium]|jgi:hypothetical protein|nr:hypothetical protein [Candidatus Saccharimonadales bacterium]